jgi:hypothetical protein
MIWDYPSISVINIIFSNGKFYYRRHHSFAATLYPSLYLSLYLSLSLFLSLSNSLALRYLALSLQLSVEYLTLSCPTIMIIH